MPKPRLRDLALLGSIWAECGEPLVMDLPIPGGDPFSALDRLVEAGVIEWTLQADIDRGSDGTFRLKVSPVRSI